MKYKVFWEVSKSAFIEAENEEQARELFYSGGAPIENEQEDEITLDPNFYKVIEK